MIHDARTSGVIGLGGVSSLDVAKHVAAFAKSGASLETNDGIGNLAKGRLPLVLIPTTAGTGLWVMPISIGTPGENAKTDVVG